MQLGGIGNIKNLKVFYLKIVVYFVKNISSTNCTCIQFNYYYYY